MTQQTPPFGLNIDAGQALLREMNRTMAALRSTEMRARQDYRQWRATTDYVPPQRDAAMDTMMNCLFTSIFLDGLFGMPLFQGAGEVTRGLAHVGAMAAQGDQDHEDPAFDYFMQHHQKKAASRKPAAFDDLMMMEQQQEYLDAMLARKNGNQQMAMLKQLTVLLMMQLMQQQRAEKEEKSGGSEGLVADALRHPKLGRFKQNRQSIACIRVMFQRQADVVTPRAKGPQLKAA